MFYFLPVTVANGKVLVPVKNWYRKVVHTHRFSGTSWQVPATGTINWSVCPHIKYATEGFYHLWALSHTLNSGTQPDFYFAAMGPYIQQG